MDILYPYIVLVKLKVSQRQRTGLFKITLDGKTYNTRTNVAGIPTMDYKKTISSLDEDEIETILVKLADRSKQYEFNQFEIVADDSKRISETPDS